MGSLLACETPPPQEHYRPRPAAAPMRPSDAGQGGETSSLQTAVEALLEACPAPTAPAAFSRQALRESAVQCVGYHLCGFERAMDGLSTRIETYAETREPAALADAQGAYAQAAALWGRLEVMQFGPLASPSMAAGEDMYEGMSLRDGVSAWPVVSACRVEQQLTSEAYADAGFARQPVSGRGLFALDQTLFRTDAAASCGATTERGQTWTELSDTERESRRVRYAQALVDDLTEQAQALRAQYAVDSGFGQRFINGDGYPSEQEALNVLAFALLYVEREVKDWKLGIPVGVTQMAPVTEVETPAARIGGRLVQGNLEGFERIFFGCGVDGAGLGFDDWLEAAGHADLASRLRSAYEGAEAAAVALPDNLEADPARLDDALMALRELTTLLKSEFFGSGSPINLKLPATVEGDTD